MFISDIFEGTESGIEAHGIRGMDRKPWQKKFRNVAAMNAWADKYDAEILGTRDLESARAGNLSPALKENAEELSIGDPVIISGNVEFNGKTGEIADFGRDKRFVVVNLYNHGKHSFHSNDVSYNDYVDSDDEEARMYDAGEFRDEQNESADETSWTANSAKFNSDDGLDWGQDYRARKADERSELQKRLDAGQKKRDKQDSTRPSKVVSELSNNTLASYAKKSSHDAMKQPSRAQLPPDFSSMSRRDQDVYIQDARTAKARLEKRLNGLGRVGTRLDRDEPVGEGVNDTERYHFLYPHVPLDMHSDHEYNKLSDNDLRAVKSHQRELATKLGKPGAKELADIASHIQINRARDVYNSNAKAKRAQLDARYAKERARKVAKEDINNPQDAVTLDIPLLIRLLEYAREDAQTDMDLHNVAEQLIKLSASGETMSMDNYDSIVGGVQEGVVGD